MTQHFPIRLAALDLDGTVLNSQKIITDITRQAIVDAIQKGAYVIPASGRALSNISREFLAIPGVEYALSSNGASIYRLSDHTQIYSRNMDDQVAYELQKRFEELQLISTPFQNEICWTTRRQMEYAARLDLSPAAIHYIQTSRRFHDHPSELIKKDGHVAKFTLNFMKAEDGTYIDRDKVLAILAEYPGLTVCSSDENDLEITALGVNKGDALLALADLLGLDHSQVLACGDSGNDLEMLKAAEIAVVMANGDPEVKAIATYITSDNDHDGVAEALDRFIR